MLTKADNQIRILQRKRRLRGASSFQITLPQIIDPAAVTALRIDGVDYPVTDAP